MLPRSTHVLTFNGLDASHEAQQPGWLYAGEVDQPHFHPFLLRAETPSMRAFFGKHSWSGK